MVTKGIASSYRNVKLSYVLSLTGNKAYFHRLYSPDVDDQSDHRTIRLHCQKNSHGLPLGNRFGIGQQRLS